MRRLLLGLAVTALAVLALAGPASAASGQVTKIRASGPFAIVEWNTESASGFTDTSIFVAQGKPGPVLSLYQLVGNSDADGNFTGGVSIAADVFSGFSFAIDRVHLATASLSATGLPATACTLDTGFSPVSCSDTTIDLNASWSGQGPIQHGVSSEHIKFDGLSVTIHDNGTMRDAAAAGTIAGLTLGAADASFTEVGTLKTGTIIRCIGLSC